MFLQLFYSINVFRRSILHVSFNSFGLSYHDFHTFSFLHIQRKNLRTDKTINFCEFASFQLKRRVINDLSLNLSGSFLQCICMLFIHQREVSEESISARQFVNLQVINFFQFLHGIRHKCLVVSALRFIVKRYGISCDDVCICENSFIPFQDAVLFLMFTILFLVRRFNLSNCLWNGCICGL